jgi:hypothetical protein
MMMIAPKIILRIAESRHAGWAYLVLIASLLGGTRSVAQVNSSQANHPSTESIASAMATGTRTELAATSSPALPTCPVGGLSSIQRTPAGNSQHSVTLSWDASAPPSRSETPTVGYCVYRRKEANAGTQPNTTLASRERITLTPVTVTSCVDDQVDGDGQYYYVITAINAKGETSPPTKEAPAAIPDKAPARADSLSAPLCRGASATK